VDFSATKLAPHHSNKVEGAARTSVAEKETEMERNEVKDIARFVRMPEEALKIALTDKEVKRFSRRRRLTKVCELVFGTLSVASFVGAMGLAGSHKYRDTLAPEQAEAVFVGSLAGFLFADWKEKTVRLAADAVCNRLIEKDRSLV
jgi:hypothetical protein